MLLAKIILGGVLAAALGVPAMAEAFNPMLRGVTQDQTQVVRLSSMDAPQPVSRPVARPFRIVVRTGAVVRPLARDDYIPTARWDSRSEGEDWTRATLAALTSEASGLEDIIPRDIAAWCPTYPDNPPELRRAFWVGMMSALAQHESTMNPSAVGGGGQWFGLLQIYPPTARHFDCEARTGEALRDPEANLACAAQIMAVTVARDQAVALHDGRWRGVAADWGPMTSRVKRAEMSAWTRSQDYCQPVMAVLTALRPQARPATPDPYWDAIRLAKL
jgi:Transglycosylase SLT domain